jgi:hypothetical protein
VITAKPPRKALREPFTHPGQQCQFNDIALKNRRLWMDTRLVSVHKR